MLTTKNERKDGKRDGIFSLLRLVLLLALGAALAGCGPAGSHALLKGKKLLDEGDYADAADEFKAATEVMTTNAEAWNYLGVADEHSGQFEESENAYKRALELNRDLTEAHYNLGCLYLEENKPDQAISEFTSYTLRRVNAPEGWVKLGVAQLQTHDLLPAEKSFSTAHYLDTNNAEALNGLGLARMQRDRPQEAEEFFQAAVQNHPDYAPAILNWATVEHEYLHNDHLALDEYRAYLALNPHPADWDEVNAIVNTLEPSSTPASPRHPQNEFNSSDAQNPVQPAPRQQEVRPQETKRERPAQQRSETTQSDYRPPREQTETVQVQPEAPIASAPNSAPRPAPQPDPFSSVENSQAPRQPDYSQVNWMSSEQSHGDVKVTPLPPENYSGTPAPVHIVQPAPPVFARYLYLSPSRPAAGNRRAASEMFSKAREYEVQRKFPDALDYYRRAARLDPSWFEAQYNAGVMAYRLRDYASSLASYETALAIEPDSVDARYNFALALQAAGYVTDAVEELRKIVASNPNDARTHLELGNLYAQQLRDIPRAREQYMKVLQLDPGNPQASNIQFWLSANPP